MRRAQFEKESEAAFYGRVAEPLCCKHAVSLRSWRGGVLMYIRCYDCGLELR